MSVGINSNIIVTPIALGSVSSAAHSGTITTVTQHLIAHPIAFGAAINGSVQVLVRINSNILVPKFGELQGSINRVVSVNSNILTSIATTLGYISALVQSKANINDTLCTVLSGNFIVVPPAFINGTLPSLSVGVLASLTSSGDITSILPLVSNNLIGFPNPVLSISSTLLCISGDFSGNTDLTVLADINIHSLPALDGFCETGGMLDLNLPMLSGNTSVKVSSICSIETLFPVFKGTWETAGIIEIEFSLLDGLMNGTINERGNINYNLPLIIGLTSAKINEHGNITSDLLKLRGSILVDLVTLIISSINYPFKLLIGGLQGLIQVNGSITIQGPSLSGYLFGGLRNPSSIDGIIPLFENNTLSSIIRVQDDEILRYIRPTMVN